MSTELHLFMNPGENLDLLHPDYQLGFFVAYQIKTPTLSIDTCPNENVHSILWGERKEYDRLSSEATESWLCSKWKRNQEPTTWKALEEYREHLYDKYLPVNFTVHLPLIKVTDLQQFKEGIICYLWNQDNCHYSLLQEDIEFNLDIEYGSSTIKLIRKKLKTESGS